MAFTLQVGATAPEFRLPVILADLEDLSYKEIADIMECPAGTVMSRLYRGRKMLQKQLAEGKTCPLCGRDVQFGPVGVDAWVVGRSHSGAITGD